MKIVLGLVALAIVLALLASRRARAALGGYQDSPQRGGDRFRNPRPRPSEGLGKILGIMWNMMLHKPKDAAPDAPLPVQRLTRAQLEAAPDRSLYRLGHSTLLLKLRGRFWITDPVFAERASPFSAGPKRFHPPPIALADLPKIDAVLVSHDHYDHLDMQAVQTLAARGTRFFVPLGIGAHLERWGVPLAQIEEMEWWQQRTLGGIEIVCTPTRHYSGRGLRDRGRTLWSSWSVLGPRHRFVYSGDTGYSTHFREIGERLGPFDLAFVKIGAYGPGAAWSDIHMPPEQSVQASRELRARRMFPVHWSTFNLAFHAWDEPIRLAVAAARQSGVEIVTPRVGEWVDADAAFASAAWWEAVR